MKVPHRKTWSNSWKSNNSFTALIDCTPGNRGCEDGGIKEPLDYMRDTGVPLAAYYPYTARTEVCKPYIPPFLKISGRTLVPMEYLEWAVQTSPLPTTFNTPESLQVRKAMV
ncbi:hypothetical protein BC332_34873 [Capsicum chinense]|nr:hypothetical protein BC332_34873 [Capsicum chinense]